MIVIGGKKWYADGTKGEMNMTKRMLSLLTALLMLLAVIPVSAGAEDYTLPMEEGKNQIVFYWDAEDANLENCDMWIWFPNADGRGYLFHPCSIPGGGARSCVPQGN